MEKLRTAMKISDKHEFGAAFDLELQEQKRLTNMAERDKIKKEKKRAKKEAKKQQEREELLKQIEMIKSNKEGELKKEIETKKQQDSDSE